MLAQHTAIDKLAGLSRTNAALTMSIFISAVAYVTTVGITVLTA